jgi:hypothetical protein
MVSCYGASDAKERSTVKASEQESITLACINIPGAVCNIHYVVTSFRN